MNCCKKCVSSKIMPDMHNDNCSCHTKQPMEWEKEFDEMFSGHNGFMNPDGTYSDQKFGPKELKAFISNLLASQRKQIMEEVEECKMPTAPFSGNSFIKVKAKNEALNEVLEIINKMD